MMDSRFNSTFFYVDEDKTFNFVGFSSALHVVFAVALTVLAQLMPPPVLDKPIEIEIVSDPKPLPIVRQKIREDRQPPVIVKGSQKSLVKPNLKVTKFEKHREVELPPVRQAKPAAVAKAARAAKIAEPDFNQDLEKPVEFAKSPALDDKFADDQFSKIDSEANKKIVDAQLAMAKSNAEVFDHLDSDVEAIKAEARADAARFGGAASARYKSELAMIAAAQRAKEAADAKARSEAGEAARRAAAAAAAEERAAGLARIADAEKRRKERMSAMAAELAAARAKGSGAGDDDEDTNQNAGPNQGVAQTGGRGTPDGVRALEDLRQMPGNRKPEYDNEDRFRRKQGQVEYLAYISREGRIVKFKLVKSTGHSTLDSKTLAALKEWRFYPGQEGWVSIPFSWDLKGGPKEMPTPLRRRAAN